MRVVVEEVRGPEMERQTSTGMIRKIGPCIELDI